jgi:AbrB family looped-hinge helix DNA binding protein
MNAAALLGGMTSLQVNVGQRGEIVIPKPVRDAIGLTPGATLHLVVKDDVVELRPRTRTTITRWEERAKSLKQRPSRWAMGSKLYEEEF